MSAVHSADFGMSNEERIKRELARELHDQVAQTLTTMLVEIEQFKDEQVGRQGVLNKLGSLQRDTRTVLQNIREILFDLRDEPVVDQDFPATIRTGLLKPFTDRTAVELMLQVSPAWPTVISSVAALSIYRVLQELLTNVRFHSGATTASVSLTSEGERVFVTVADNGRGIDTSNGSRGHGMGLLGVRERVALLGGDVTVKSAPGEGTEVTASFPLEAVL